PCLSRFLCACCRAPDPFPTRRSSDLQVRRHFLDIADASPVPFLPYHFPQVAGASSTIQMLVELAEHDNIVGFKFTSRDVYELQQDRKSTRLNSSHVKSSYAVFCLKKK